MIGISGSLIWSKTMMELIFNLCGEFRWSPESPASLISSPPCWGPWDLLRSVQMLKREWGAERNGKLAHLSIPSKTAALVPESAVENLHLGRTAALVPEFAVKDLPLGRTLMMMYTGLSNVSIRTLLADLIYRTSNDLLYVRFEINFLLWIYSPLYSLLLLVFH